MTLNIQHKEEWSENDETRDTEREQRTIRDLNFELLIIQSGNSVGSVSCRTTVDGERRNTSRDRVNGSTVGVLSNCSPFHVNFPQQFVF